MFHYSLRSIISAFHTISSGTSVGGRQRVRARLGSVSVSGGCVGRDGDGGGNVCCWHCGLMLLRQRKDCARTERECVAVAGVVVE